MTTTFFPLSLCSFAISILLVFPFIHLASAAAINPPALSFLASNQSNPQRNNLPITSNLGNPPYNCVNTPKWTSQGWNPFDCQSALLRLALTESDRHGDHDFEFLGPGSDPTSRLPTMSTPRRYTSGFFHPEELPGIRCSPCYPTDITSYREIYWAAFALRLQCVAEEHQFGWTDVGARRSIGIFVWAAGSSLDKRVPEDGPRVLRTISGMGNISTS